MSESTPSTAVTADIPELSATAKAGARMVLWRILPLMCLLYIINFLDRSAISYAGPNGMNTDLMLTEGAFGLASGLYFVGQIPFAVPINFWVVKFGPHRAIALVAIVWGLVEAVTAFVPNAGVLYVARIALGVAEAGFFPAMLTYMRQWLPARPRGLATTILLSSTAVASVVGGPLAVSFIDWGNAIHFTGWKFMFLVAGLVAVVLGLVTPLVFKRDHYAVKWLPEEQAKALVDQLEFEDRITPEVAPNFGQAFRSGRLWVIVIVGIVSTYVSYTLTFFLPTIVGQVTKGFSPLEISLIAALPLVCTVIASIVGGSFINSHGVSPVTLALLSFAVQFVGALVCYFSGANGVVNIIGLCLLDTAVTSASFVLVGNMFNGGAAAAALALLAALGNAGGLIGPYVIGLIEDATGTARPDYIVIAILLVLAFLTYLILGRSIKRSLQKRHSMLQMDGTQLNPEYIDTPLV